ncbi:cytochrome c oxidase assembly factor Coa1 family protein [Psychroserpens ponticola]|uniref:Cytochrome c oxidase assembly factor Coa1 family protein n=1 Tax=Psychroserpens ponticola TaxID=2932268 RepID=A0ABY7RZ26_9FLAO|nr:cytochrome c oxidase assembly factor Coa1 family protein [Psychroserpens ponticola]WCO01486.1 cytochrome c oxidase assembly factor Coa1 family protein [Psychroserpens ponticola]
MEEVRQKSWFGRNWLWVLPVGGCLTVIVLFVLGIGAVFYGVTNVVKNSTPYEYSFDLAQNDIRVQNALGAPIITNGMFQGEISLKNNRGEADIKIPIKGENGQATIIVLATKENDEWIYEKLYVLIKASQEEINLIGKNLEGI